MTNRYPGTCCKCRVAVDAGQGVYRSGYVYCRPCFDGDGQPAPTKRVAITKRRINRLYPEAGK